MQRFLILFFCFCITKSAVAQPPVTAHTQLYTTDNGLPSNGIKGLQWDEKTNFLWIATEAGIVRFNGVDFRSYTKENLPSIASERMLFMVRNNAGTIYVSDLSGNIFSINKNKPVVWKKATDNINPYFANYYLLPVSDTFFKTHSGVSKDSRFSAVTDKILCLSDTSFFILNHGTLFYQSISLKKPFALLFEKSSFNTVFKIDSNYFIRNNKKEIFLFNTGSQTLTPVLFTDENGTALKPQTGNSLLYWETGMEKPVYVDGEKAWLLTYSENKIIAKWIFTGIPSDALIKSIQYSEKNKILFIGTDSKGLIVLNQSRMLSKKRDNANSKNRNSYYSQIELTDGSVLTNEGDIISDKISSPVNPLPIQGKFSFNISQTNDSLFWYTQVNTQLGYNCLHKFNKITRRTKVYKKIIWGDVVTSSGAAIYLANPTGIGILEADSMRFLHRYPAKSFGNTTFDFTEISAGVLAIATCSGLLRFNTVTNVLDTIFRKENICVRSIWKYKEYVFFGTYGSGFYIFKNGKIKPMPLDKNKYLLYTHCFMPDDDGYCWISTNRGLFKSSLSELINAFEKNSTAVYYHYFGKKDGMEMTELNGGCTPCALQLKNKTISFPTMDGLLWVNPQKALPVLPEGEIYIDEIIADNNKINTDSLPQKNLPSQTQEIIIALGFSAWGNKENIYLDYQLNDTVNWKIINTDNDAVIRLNNLPSGKYVLLIRKLNGFGINNYSYKQISFTISTPWHKQWWFYLLCFLTAVGLTALYLQLRTRQYKIRQRKLEMQVAEKTKELIEKNEVLEKNNTIKTRLISIISHDIVTPLKFVTSAGKNLIEKRNLMSEELQKETIQEITNTSQELQLLSTNILNWIKYQNENRRLAKENFNLYEIVNQVTGVLHSLAKQKKITLVNAIDPALIIYQYFEPLKILIYNLLTNAINFSEKGDITIAVQPAEEKLIISVTDEGVGMTAEQINNIMADQFIVSSANIDNRKGNGLGYLIIKDLIKMLDAKLQINSEKNNGTTVSIKLNVSPLRT
jgi:signal transduction histidine kinase